MLKEAEFIVGYFLKRVILKELRMNVLIEKEV